MSIQPQKTTLSLPVEIRWATRMLDGRIVISGDCITYSPASLRSAEEDLREVITSLKRKPVCLISRRRLRREDAVEKEHIILQGLGTRWVFLRPGLVSDTVNNDLSTVEKQFLRHGLMGALRPFYTTGKKAQEFVDPRGRRVVFRHDPERGFSVELFGGDPIRPKIEPSGEGEFDIDLVLNEPATMAVSRALAKMAYLVLCIRAPRLALSPLLNETRELIVHGRPKNYKPYSERFISGAWPGYQVFFWIEEREIGGGEAEPTRIIARLRLHHALYEISLAGGKLDAVSDDDTLYYPVPRKPGRRKRTITWRFGSISETGG